MFLAIILFIVVPVISLLGLPLPYKRPLIDLTLTMIADLVLCLVGGGVLITWLTKKGVKYHRLCISGRSEDGAIIPDNDKERARPGCRIKVLRGMRDLRGPGDAIRRREDGAFLPHSDKQRARPLYTYKAL